MLLIYDEVMSGAGRTGRYLAAEHWPKPVSVPAEISRGTIGELRVRINGMTLWLRGAASNSLSDLPQHLTFPHCLDGGQVRLNEFEYVLSQGSKGLDASRRIAL